MALVTLPRPIAIGPDMAFRYPASTGTAQSTVADAAGEGMACVFQAMESVTIDAVAFIVASATGSPTVKVSIQALDASGDPDGTPIGTEITSGTLSAGTVLITGLGASVTLGVNYAAVIVYASGTSVTLRTGHSSSTNTSFPHMANNVGAGWVKLAYSLYGVPIALGTSGTAMLAWDGFAGPATINSTSYTNASNPDEYALRWAMPFKMRVIGLVAALGAPAAGTFSIVMTDSSGNDVGSTYKSYDADISALTTQGRMQLLFASSFVTTANSVYFCGIKSDSTGNMAQLDSQFTSNIYLPAYYSADWYLGTRNNAVNGTGTAWTTNDLRVPRIFPLVDQIDDGAGGGGGGGLRIVSSGGLG